MFFPEAPRVIYERNPLTEVICQVRFSRVLRLESDLPAAFQDAVRGRYPDLRELQTIRIPDEVARALGPLAPTPGRVFEFVNKTNTSKIGLTSNFLAISTTAYKRWEDFAQELFTALDLLDQVYQISEYTRVGLRYRNTVDPVALGLGDSRWDALLRKELLGELLDPRYYEATIHAARELVLALGYDDARVRIVHGLVAAETEKPSPRLYQIDSDFFRETGTERKDAADTLDRFHREAGRLFRWCITEDLHRALRPSAPAS
jgi:uncharacterized protein (TIGR04255 family)